MLIDELGRGGFEPPPKFFRQFVKCVKQSPLEMTIVCTEHGRFSPLKVQSRLQMPHHSTFCLKGPITPFFQGSQLLISLLRRTTEGAHSYKIGVASITDSIPLPTEYTTVFSVRRQSGTRGRQGPSGSVGSRGTPTLSWSSAGLALRCLRPGGLCPLGQRPRLLPVVGPLSSMTHLLYYKTYIRPRAVAAPALAAASSCAVGRDCISHHPPLSHRVGAAASRQQVAQWPLP